MQRRETRNSLRLQSQAVKETVKEATKPKDKRKALVDVGNAKKGEVAVAGVKKTLAVVKVTEITKRRSLREVTKKVSAPLVDVEVQPVASKKVAVAFDDLDIDDKNDPMMVSEYVVEIFEYLRELELEHLAHPNYITRHKELHWKMRNILIDWLVDVHLKFKLLPETLYLTINIIDRFLSIRVCTVNKLQLVGITAMFIASKYEEVYAPPVSQFVYITDGGFSHDEIIRAERYILSTLNFSLQYPNPLNFLRRCSKADGYDIQTRTLAKYFMELTLINEQYISVPPSKVAASAMYLSRAMIEREQPVWTNNLTHYSGYEAQDLKSVVLQMLKDLTKESKHVAIYNKYATSKLIRASTFAEDWATNRKENVEWGLTF